MDIGSGIPGFEYKWEKFLVLGPLEPNNRHSDGSLAGLPPGSPLSLDFTTLGQRCPFFEFFLEKGHVCSASSGRIFVN